MNLLRKSVISFAGVTAAALLLAVASPRTVHALGGIGDTLVRITNTAAAPAVAEEVPHTASHLITIGGYINGTSNYPLKQLNPDGSESTNEFEVPAGKSFVITGIDITPMVNAPTTVNIQSFAGGYYGQLTVLGIGTTEFQYSSGWVVESGVTLYAFADQVATASTSVIVHGYLTTI
jgi:hypothetical protein